MNHPSEEEVVLFLYGDTSGGNAVASHLDTCADCQAVAREVQRTLQAIDTHRIPERGPEYGAYTWARLQPRLGPPPGRSWRLWFSPPRLALGAGVAALVVAAFFAGRYSLNPQPARQARTSESGTPTNAATPRGQVGNRVLLVAVGDHLERSQVMLVELLNQPPEAEVDISGTREWARELVPANRLIRQTANEEGELLVADVLDELERLLVEVANGPSRLSSDDFRQIRDRIDAQGIIFRIRVLDSQMHEREEAAARRATASHS